MIPEFTYSCILDACIRDVCIMMLVSMMYVFMMHISIHIHVSMTLILIHVCMLHIYIMHITLNLVLDPEVCIDDAANLVSDERTDKPILGVGWYHEIMVLWYHAAN